MKKIAILILFLGMSTSYAHSGSEAYGVCKDSPTVAACKACCAKDCHDTNLFGDLFGLCTNRCQKNCTLYNGGAVQNLSKLWKNK